MMQMSMIDELNYSQYLIHGQSNGDNLFGFEFDVNAYICDYEKCFYISRERTDNPNCMLILYCRFANNFTSQQMADYLESKWLKYICYREFEKHYIEWVDDQLHFYYVTGLTPELGVTGKIITT